VGFVSIGSSRVTAVNGTKTVRVEPGMSTVRVSAAGRAA
jgi:hypothetical protein